MEATVLFEIADTIHWDMLRRLQAAEYERAFASFVLAGDEAPLPRARLAAGDTGNAVAVAAVARTGARRSD